MPRLTTLLLSLSLLAALPSHAEQRGQLPTALASQIERLVELLGDAYATGYPEASLYRLQNPRQDDSLAFAVFTVEGFYGGNGHAQYLAAFRREVGANGQEHYQFLDVLWVGGAAVRRIDAIGAMERRADNKVRVHLQGMASAANDAPNFPSLPMNTTRDLIDGRFQEQP